MHTTAVPMTAEDVAMAPESPWDEIIAAVIAAIIESINERDEQQVFRVLRRGGWRCFIVCRRACRAGGLAGQDLRLMAKEMLMELRGATDFELRGLIAEAMAVSGEDKIG